MLTKKQINKIKLSNQIKLIKRQSNLFVEQVGIVKQGIGPVVVGAAMLIFTGVQLVGSFLDEEWKSFWTVKGDLNNLKDEINWYIWEYGNLETYSTLKPTFDKLIKSIDDVLHNYDSLDKIQSELDKVKSLVEAHKYEEANKLVDESVPGSISDRINKHYNSINDLMDSGRSVASALMASRNVLGIAYDWITGLISANGLLGTWAVGVQRTLSDLDTKLTPHITKLKQVAEKISEIKTNLQKLTADKGAAPSATDTPAAAPASTPAANVPAQEPRHAPEVSEDSGGRIDLDGIDY